jgi:hypothetical protein
VDEDKTWKCDDNSPSRNPAAQRRQGSRVAAISSSTRTFGRGSDGTHLSKYLQERMSHLLSFISDRCAATSSAVNYQDASARATVKTAGIGETRWFNREFAINSLGHTAAGYEMWPLALARLDVVEHALLLPLGDLGTLAHRRIGRIASWDVVSPRPARAWRDSSWR